MDRERIYEREIKINYGLSIEQYKNLLIAQDNRCAICGQYENSFYSKRLCVDHDHSTGKVRGLLCRKCNTALGAMKDNIQTLQNAIDYLKKSTGL